MKLATMLMTQIGRKKLWTLLHRFSWPVSSRFAGFYRRVFLTRVKVVAVVGSFGKTTTTSAIKTALNLSAKRIAGNIGSYLAKEVLLISPRDEYSILEAGIDRPGLMKTYSRMIRPDIVVVTSVGSEHNRSLKSLETTRFEKSRILSGLSSNGIAILNGDDPNVRWMARETDARIITCGFEADNDYRAVDVKLEWPTGTNLIIRSRDQEWSVKTGLIGNHLVFSVLAAVVTGIELGIPIENVLQRLNTLQPSELRMDPIQLENGAILLRDEYKSTEETIVSALATLTKIPARRRFIIIGDVSEPFGSIGPIYRGLGERMGKIADRVIVVGNNFQRYSAGARRIGKKYGIFFDAGKQWYKAAEFLREEIRKGDVVLIKGRDTQRFDRIALHLQGKKVSCQLSFCQAVNRCRGCPEL